MEYREAILECQETSYNTKKNPLMDYPGPFMKNQEALSNTTPKLYMEYQEIKKLHGIPRSCPEIPRSSLKYHEVLTKTNVTGRTELGEKG